MKYINLFEAFGDSTQKNKTIICVDIQPEYFYHIPFDLKTWVRYINRMGKNNTIVFLYNGYDTLGMVTEYDYKEWLMEQGIKEDVVYSADFYDKGYAFFRYCIDNASDFGDIVCLVKFILSNNINDSRDIDEEQWDEFIEKYQHASEIRELLENNDDVITIPDLISFLKPLYNIILMGGGKDECLLEVEIALSAINKPYKLNDAFVY